MAQSLNQFREEYDLGSIVILMLAVLLLGTVLLPWSPVSAVAVLLVVPTAFAAYWAVVGSRKGG